MYGYQLLQAKINGADAIRLHASILSPTELEYNIKVARAVGLSCLVVVSTAAQTLAVLDGVPSLEALVVSSRNHLLWKVDGGKAIRIIRDAAVAPKLAVARAERGLLLLAEGFVDRADVEEAGSTGVDAVVLAEELLRTDETSVRGALSHWIM